MIPGERIQAFSELGEEIKKALDGVAAKYSSHLKDLIETQHINNPWFTPANVRLALKAIAHELTYENLVKWTNAYPLLNNPPESRTVGVIMAGNIPLAGFHDFLSVLITGNKLLAKTSEKDPDLIRFISEMLCDINPGFRRKIEITSGVLHDFDAVIATGSDNSSRYFEYYFGKYPHIIRKNRNSIGVLEGNEISDELALLGNDIFSYFGLGCRNVSKVFIPKGYDFTPMIKSWSSFARLIDHNKYANNYDFNKAVCLVNKEKFLDTGFVLLKENHNISSPVAVVHFENYNTYDEVKTELERNKDKIQCTVGNKHIPFGGAQAPALWDYADSTDTIEFLLKKISAGIL